MHSNKLKTKKPMKRWLIH